jgi:predicted aspartyl protease
METRVKKSLSSNAPIAALLLAVALTPPADGRAEDSTWKPFSKAVAVCRVEEPSGLFVGQLKLGSHPIPCVIDTGASVTLVDSSLAPGLGEAVAKVTLNQESGGGTLSGYRADSIEILGVKDHGLSHVYAFDLSPIREDVGSRIGAIVGMDFLKAYCLCVDYDASLLCICQREHVRFDQLKDRCTLNLSESRRPFVAAWIGDRFREEMIIDTGYVGTAALSPKAFDRAVSIDVVRRLKNNHAKWGADGVKWVASGKLSLVKFGNWELRDLVVSKNEPSVMGLYFLRRFRVVLDFPGTNAYFEKSPAFDALDHDDNDGLRVFNHLGFVKIDAVEPDSFADRSGFRAGEILLFVGDKVASDLGVHGVRRVLVMDQRDSIECVVVRNGEPRTITLRRSPSAARGDVAPSGSKNVQHLEPASP